MAVDKLDLGAPFGTGSSPTGQAAARLNASRVDPSRVIQRIAEAAEAIGWQAGVGAMETAGSIVSYLAAHPEDLPKLMDGTLSVIDWPDRWHIHGVLTWQNAEGKVFTPEFARRHLAIKQLEKGA